MTAGRLEPKRSQLAQERSRDTRRAIVKAALELWTQRGFDHGVEQTTAEEIATRAGVSKATFYLHFGRKEDILRHAGWIAPEAMYEDALAEVAAGHGLDEAVDRMLLRLGRRVQKVPRAALRRVLHAQRRVPREHVYEDGSFGLEKAFLVVLKPAQDTGELPAGIGVPMLASMLKAVTMDALWNWAIYGADRLPDVLRQRAAVVLAGARHLPADQAEP
ncbi:HTH tetR-type domain-containing protein [Frankia sp. AiPs1]|uniref:TetR/AcrR family transcriptional regulator n=1 Tax=Frankia sp. AiPa1 TaxID=573492 RepID=UPI00202ADA94|nr:TetR/AcrR family transcriptional regulator [Frankia sp. AiPa1]MCL9762649.1 TetR/AcrR family transcriptional regulator [Frankia sp. AiPa1]